MARKTIGTNPLDALIPAAPVQAEERLEEQSSERVSVNLPADLVNRAKNLVYWTPGETLAGLIARSLEAEVARIEKERGEVFPERPNRKLTPGRPVY